MKNFTLFQKEKKMSRVTAVVCESKFGLFLAATTLQHTMNYCDRNTRLQLLPATENLMNEIASITGKQLYTLFINMVTS